MQRLHLLLFLAVFSTASVFSQPSHLITDPENDFKGIRTLMLQKKYEEAYPLLKEAKMELLYVPYEPDHFESMILQNRNILADQMEYLLTGVPKHSRIIKLS